MANYLFVVIQTDFKTVRYAVIGDDTASKYFEIDDEEGILSIRRKLENDKLELYRVSNG